MDIPDGNGGGTGTPVGDGKASVLGVSATGKGGGGGIPRGADTFGADAATTSDDVVCEVDDVSLLSVSDGDKGVVDSEVG